MQIRHRVDIAAPAERVWKLTQAVEDWPCLTPTITSVRPLDSQPLRVGSRYELKQPGQPAAVWTVSRLEPGKLFEWKAGALTGRHEIEPTDSGCRNVLTLEVPAWMLVLYPLLKHALKTENAGFKKGAES